MYNVIQNLYQSLTDSQLKEALVEIQESSKTGIIPDGHLRRIANQIAELTLTPVSTQLMMTEVEILRLAAYKWLNLNQ